MGIKIEVYGASDVGLMREGNEDSFEVADIARGHIGMDSPLREHVLDPVGGSLFLVCDGMGGAQAGEVASRIAVDTIISVMRLDPLPDTHHKLVRRMDRAIREASTAIFQSARRDMKKRGMGTTVTAASLIDGRLFIGQVGDSRGYIMRGDEIFLVTKDQSLLNQLLEAGQITPEEAQDFEYGNVILQAAGTQEKVDPEFSFVDLVRGDRLLVCSDGLHGMVGDDVIAYSILNGESLEASVKALIAQANANGGHDNISAVLVRFGEGLPEPDGTRILYQTVTVEQDETDLAPGAQAPAAATLDSFDDEDFPEVTIV